MDASCAWRARPSAPNVRWKIFVTPPTSPGAPWRSTKTQRRRSLRNFTTYSSQSHGLGSQHLLHFFVSLILGFYAESITVYSHPDEHDCYFPNPTGATVNHRS